MNPSHTASHPPDLGGSVFAKESASAEAIWILAERLSGEHIAQVYSHETVLVESLRMFTTHGLSLCGLSPDESLVEMIELADHPFFLASQFHPEFKSRPLDCHPMFKGFIKAVLDWEMATLGDPLMDLGSTLGYWVEADDAAEWRQQSFGVTTLPGNLNREQLLELTDDSQLHGRLVSLGRTELVWQRADTKEPLPGAAVEVTCSSVAGGASRTMPIVPNVPH